MDTKLEWISWNGNIHHTYIDLVEPTTLTDLQTAVSGAKQVRIIGTGRSSADIVAGSGRLISLQKMASIEMINREQRQITVLAGIMLADLLKTIEAEGWEIATLPDLDCITLGGALATGTHGTGRNAQILSAYVLAMDLVLADGTILHLSQTDHRLDAARVSLGLLGVIARVVLQCQVKRTLAIHERPVKTSQWLPDYGNLLQKHEFVRILYLPHTGCATLITGDSIPSGSDPQNYPKKAAPRFHRHRREWSQALYRWCKRLPSFLPMANRIIYSLFFRSEVRKVGSLYDTTVTKSRGSTLELAEWTIPFHRFQAAWIDLETALAQRPLLAGVHIPMDIRFIRHDSAWLSYASHGDTVTIGCVCRLAEYAQFYKAFGLVESIFLKHGAKPHWAKRFTAGPQQLAPLYPHWQDFIALRTSLDPTGKFLTPYLSSLFGTQN